MDEALRIENVTKVYGQGALASMVLHGLTLAVRRGEFVSIMGPSGSGKSTLLNVSAGLDVPTSGRVFVAGRDIAGLTDDQRSDLRLQTIGVVFQTFNLFPTFTVEENVMWPLEFQGRPVREARGRAHEMLQHVGVSTAAFARRPTELSGGEQQRTAIARALVTKPTLLLADEPTGNLDSHTGQVVLDLLRRLNRDDGLTIVMVTHSALAATYGDRTIELRDGRMIRDVRAHVGGGGRVIPLRE